MAIGHLARLDEELGCSPGCRRGSRRVVAYSQCLKRSSNMPLLLVRQRPVDVHKINLFRGRCRSIFELSLPEFLRNAENRELFLSGLRLAAGETDEPGPPPCCNPRRLRGGSNWEIGVRTTSWPRDAHH